MYIYPFTTPHLKQILIYPSTTPEPDVTPISRPYFSRKETSVYIHRKVTTDQPFSLVVSCFP